MSKFIISWLIKSSDKCNYEVVNLVVVAKVVYTIETCPDTVGAGVKGTIM